MVTSRCWNSIESRFVLFMASLVKRDGAGWSFPILGVGIAILGSSGLRKVFRVRFARHNLFSHDCRSGVLKFSSIAPQLRLNRSMSFIANRLVKFEEHEIDRARWQLSWRDETLPLNRKTFDLLLYLVDHADRVVGKEELLRKLWPESFVEESNLTQHIFLLRKALSRHDSGLKFIETVPGRGYRFTAPVAVVGAEQSTADRMAIRASESISQRLIQPA